MRNTWAQKIYDEVMNASSLTDVENIFNGTKYISKTEMGAILGEMIGGYNMNITDKLKIALKSKKYKDNMDCVSENDEPIIICLLKSFFNNVRNGNIPNKTMLKAFIFDKTISYNWDVTNKQNETPFHVIINNANILNDLDFDHFFSEEIIGKINPLNKNECGKNIIQLFKEQNLIKNKNRKKKILNCFHNVVKSQTITIKSDCYKCCETEEL